MKFVIRTTIALVALSLAMGSFALAQNPPGEQISEGSEPTARQPIPEPVLPVPAPPKPAPAAPVPPQPPGTSTPGVAVSPSRPTAPTLPNQYPTRGKRLGRIGSRKVLVVPANEVKAEDLAEIMEDMQVMSYIFDGRFKETRRIQGGFIDFGDFFGRDNRTTEAIYLQGYGVLFLMEVNFVFSSPPKPQAQESDQSYEHSDSTWLQAKQEVFSPGDSRRPGQPNMAEEYDGQMVVELIEELGKTLRHAANIRNMQSSEWVILTIIGGGRQSGGVFSGRGFMMGGMGMSTGSVYGGTSSDGTGGFGGGYGTSGGFGGGYGTSGGSGGGVMMGRGSGGGMMGGMGGGMGGMTGYSEMGVSAATVLTIRAKKSEIDAFARGEEDFEQFRQKVQIFTY